MPITGHINKMVNVNKILVINLTADLESAG